LGIESNLQLAIFIVFAITGSTSAWVSKPVCLWLGIVEEDFGNWFVLIRLLIIFPLYQVLLVLIGTLFGQFNFFWNFEKNAKSMAFLLKTNSDSHICWSV
jgi:hypothetical protein